MAIETRYLCESNNAKHLKLYKTGKEIKIYIYHDDQDNEIVFNSVILTKQDVKKLIKELNLLIKNLD
jgi:hypothetical protein